MRRLVAAAGQLGPVPSSESAGQTIDRLVSLMEGARSDGVQLIVYPELALTAFFPHWLIEDEDELLSYYRQDLANGPTSRLFEAAHELGVSFVLGYAEVTEEGRRFNTSVLVDSSGEVVLKYRKIHLPGFADFQPGVAHQLLEKRYFEVGDLGFPVSSWRNTRVGLAICNDRRWAETYRVLALQGAELICLGYNTPVATPHLPELDELAYFHNELSVQAGAYQNSLWVVAAAKAGREEGVDQIGGSLITAPSGQVVARASTTGDELIAAEIDLDMSTRYRRDVFDFAAHRRPESYHQIIAPVAESARWFGPESKPTRERA